MELFDRICTKIVVDQVWFSFFLCELFCELDREFEHSSNVNTKFWFNNGEEVYLQKIMFSVVIDVKKTMIKVSIADNEIILLLCKALMKRAQLILNLTEDTA